VDFVARAVDKASAKADKVAVGSNFGLIVDNGCLHGMSAEDRDAYVREVTAVAADWTLLSAGDEPAWDRNGQGPGAPLPVCARLVERGNPGQTHLQRRVARKFGHRGERDRHVVYG
jgi:hypothetical protein